jgi:hypothetical protein
MPMRDLSAAATLDLWQAAEELVAAERPLALAAAVSDEPIEELARLPLGRRDARVLELHAALGGRALEATAACPVCSEPAEFEVEVAALRSRVRRQAVPEPVDAGGLVVAWRPPDSTDVAAAAATGDQAAAERVLLSRCVTSPDELPAEARTAVAAAMAECDPLAEVLVDVVCPACETVFVADLDLGSFVWAELRARALRLLREVDVLARAYGWAEAEVLALDERRRNAYLELVREGAR